MLSLLKVVTAIIKRKCFPSFCTHQPEATNLPATQRFKEKNKLSEKERVKKSLTVHRKELKVKNVYQGKRGLKSIKETLLPAITDHISYRFASFTGKI